MIEVTRLNNKSTYINNNLIEFMESTPDTVITFITGRKIVIKESPEEIVEKIIVYQNKIHDLVKFPIIKKEGEV
ncbi:flagellar FlbD family protein [Proteinivorax hydrogeniformans]|uniref:Flagellar FlbD family protein n=1 Tax=Proteinivorax hydrogeniformans TaxID=1826727 RepID=A0AAU8HP20_9FIRM